MPTAVEVWSLNNWTAREVQKVILFFVLKISQFFCVQNKFLGTCLAVQWLGLCALIAEGMGSIPVWGTKIPQAMWCGQKTKQNKFLVLSVLP